MLQISRSSYYNWLQKPLSNKKQEDIELTFKIKMIFNKSRKNYGTRRIKKELAFAGVFISRRRIRNLMQKSGLVCKNTKKFKHGFSAKTSRNPSPNLLNRQFNPVEMNQVWVGDITYIPTKKGWLYLATVIDLYSRKIIGWSMANNMKTQLVNDALLMAIWKRKPSKGLLWHTDQGSQYGAKSHRNILKEHNINQSMSRKGNCWDNAVAESFFKTLKTELVADYNFENQEVAKSAVFEYIEIFYNKIRLHSANNYTSPQNFEEKLITKSIKNICPV